MYVCTYAQIDFYHTYLRTMDTRKINTSINGRYKVLVAFRTLLRSVIRQNWCRGSGFFRCNCIYQGTISIFGGVLYLCRIRTKIMYWAYIVTNLLNPLTYDMDYFRSDVGGFVLRTYDASIQSKNATTCAHDNNNQNNKKRKRKQSKKTKILQYNLCIFTTN